MILWSYLILCRGMVLMLKNFEARELEERIAENVVKLLEETA